MSSATKDISPRIRVRRKPKNAHYDRESIYRVLDRGQLVHVSFVVDGEPYCVPTLHARVCNRVLIHGSSASRMMRVLAAGAPACLTVTVLDGLVLARSVFETGVNYDSVMLLGRFRPITEDEEKLNALQAFVEALLPGRWAEVRPPSRQELKGTAILEMEIGEASVKTKTGGPDDDASPDGQRNVWAGVIPIETTYGTPQPSPGLRAGIALSPSVSRLANHRLGYDPQPCQTRRSR
jgi:nitroimidazol reductase NimA-like FMN-containing flavoprotein (pyridoxamine 5'-phosphate oxidase superfamily)